ncbi:M81 family metallopeptidase [Pseudochelatococcus sp. G4_1912]|uniref:M81 family metallopeptidase n=1 Tax=Pseudochelatococcus sp. G4_1912 TaxID=3114288 RepID=UPI0039C6E33C
MHLFIACMGTETNSFSSLPTGMQGFRETMLCHGDGTANGRHPIVEPLRVWRKLAEARGIRVSESLSAFAEPAGNTSRKVYEELRDEILTDLKAALPVNMVLLSLHGAMIAEGYLDPEGELVAAIRDIVGPDVIIGVEYDLHVHLTRKKTEPANIVVTYKEYPHTDIADRAYELFDIAIKTAEGTAQPQTSIVACPINAYLPTTSGAMREFVDSMIAEEKKPGILSVSLAHGFPHGDVPEVGAKVIVITDGNPELAQNTATKFAQALWTARHQLLPNYLSIEAGIDAALAFPTGPVVMADTSDNAGCGAPNDSTFILQRLLERGVTDIVAANYWDPIAVRFAMEAGVGATLRLRIGGKSGAESGAPVDLTVKVMGIKEDATQTFNGIRVSIGDAVWVQGSGIDIIINSKRFQTGNPDMMTQLGLDPTTRKIIVVKSTQHFYAGFGPIASEVLYVAGPGGTNPNTRNLSYDNMAAPYWPKETGTIGTFAS